MSKHQCVGFEEAMKMCRTNIDNGCWTVMPIVDADYAYTIGLTSLGLPELVICGLPPQRAGVVLNCMAAWLVNEKVNVMYELSVDNYAVYTDDSPFTGHVGVARVDPAHNDMFGMGFRFYPAMEIIQVVWCDANNKFPWDVDSQFDKGQKYHNMQRMLMPNVVFIA